MGSAYEGVLQRLQMYRQKRKLNQKSMSQMMGVTQSHYSKLEQGKTIISAEELKNFDSHGCNMDYLLTGEECEETILNHYLGVCKKEIKSDFLQLMVWTIEQGINISGKEQKNGVDYTKEIRLRGADYMNFDMGKIYMMITVAIVPIIIVYLLLSKYIIAGVTLGGVKE